jgi:hypothetical protein
VAWARDMFFENVAKFLEAPGQGGYGGRRIFKKSSTLGASLSASGERTVGVGDVSLCGLGLVAVLGRASARAEYDPENFERKPLEAFRMVIGV